jgi:hypothetical protein
MTIDTTTLPEAGSKWTLDGLPVVVDSVKKKGRGYYVVWGSENSGGRVALADWKRKAKAA